MNGKMTAKRLRIILIIVVVSVIAGVAGGFLFVQKNLAGYAKQISQLNADAETGDQSIETRKKLETRLDSEQSTIDAAQSIIGDSSSFADRIVGDVTRIAAESGVKITSFEFIDTPAAAAGGTATTTPAPTTPAPTGAAAPTTATVPAGVTKKSISVSIETPLAYDKFMNFIKKIESNDLKLQIADVKLTAGDKGTVGTQSFSIGAYVR